MIVYKKLDKLLQDKKMQWKVMEFVHLVHNAARGTGFV